MQLCDYHGANACEILASKFQERIFKSCALSKVERNSFRQLYIQPILSQLPSTNYVYSFICHSIFNTCSSTVTIVHT